MTKLKEKRKYISPAVETTEIEVQQVLLSGSDFGQTENLGNEKEEIGWGANTRRRGTWGNLWAE